MKIKNVLSQIRRDFRALYECGHCGATQESYGYDDINFHQNVIPTMKCDKCGKVGEPDYKPRATKYAEDEIV